MGASLQNRCDRVNCPKNSLKAAANDGLWSTYLLALVQRSDPTPLSVISTPDARVIEVTLQLEDPAPHSAILIAKGRLGLV